MGPKKANKKALPQNGPRWAHPAQSASVQLQPTNTQALVTTRIQQHILDVFRQAHPEIFGSGLSELLQTVKKHLYDRNFPAAFGESNLREAYCSRWSPSRALGYANIFRESPALIELMDQAIASLEKFKIVCLGGGAGAELVTFGAIVNIILESQAAQPGHLKVELVDIADWNQVLTHLHDSMSVPPPLSKFAASHVEKATRSLVDAKMLEYSFIQQDILELEMAQARNLLSDSNLVTIFFTLNELYTSSVSKTNVLLLKIRDLMPFGSHLLVIDSAGSYATVTLNGKEKQYPMQWLLDYTILGNSNDMRGHDTPLWTKIQESSSEWFRLGDGLQYPLDLENMRYQIHLYRKESNP
jgi:25S rRNA (uracil2843-N3)-methyltransferase